VKCLEYNIPDLIKKSMYSIINGQIRQEEIRNMLLEFVDYQSKKGFPFGELLILHFDLFNEEKDRPEEIYLVAAAMEFLVLSFDILDDFEDADHKNTPWSTRPALALNSTTNLLFLIIKIVRNTNFKNKDKGISLFIEYSLKSINGQYKDLLNICKTESDYIDMAIEKSGSLVALACLLGTILATDEYPENIETYSKYIGLIGQINNDIADVNGSKEKNDLINKEYSLPIIYLLSSQDEKLQFIRDYYENKVNKSKVIENLEQVKKKIHDSGAILYTEVIKKIYQNKAKTEMESLNLEPSVFSKLLKYIY
jgi:competence protein ComQ